MDGDLVIGESESLFKKTVTRLLEEGKVNLLVDMRRVSFLDSSGLGALVRALTNSQKEGGQTKLLGRRPPGPEAPRDDQARLGVRELHRHGDRGLELLAGTPGLQMAERTGKSLEQDGGGGSRRSSRSARTSRRPPGWAARWSARMAGADGALLWAPDTAIPIFLCIAAEGEGTRVFLRRSAPRDTGTVHDLLRDRRPTALDRKDFASSQDPLVKGFPAEIQTCLAVPLEAEGQVVGLLALLFEQPQRTEPRVSRASSASCSTRRRRSPGRCAPSARPSACSTPSSG